MAHPVDRDNCEETESVTSPTANEECLSAEEREQIIQYVISTQMIEGIELDYDFAAELIDIAYSQPLPLLTQHLH